MNKLYIRFLVAAAVLIMIAAYYGLGLDAYFTLDGIKNIQHHIDGYYQTHTLATILVFAGVYVAMTTFSIPAASLLTLLAGALFGFSTGLVVTSLASTTGATLAFLMARFVLHNTVQEKYSHRLAVINKGFEKEGAFYLFALRLVPAFPFFLINLVMGLVPIKTWTYFWVSLVGMLPGTAVYVYAGTALAQIDSLRDIASPQVLVAFALLGLLPLVLRKTLKFIKKAKHEV